MSVRKLLLSQLQHRKNAFVSNSTRFSTSYHWLSDPLKDLVIAVDRHAFIVRCWSVSTLWMEGEYARTFKCLQVETRRIEVRWAWRPRGVSSTTCSLIMMHIIEDTSHNKAEICWSTIIAWTSVVHLIEDRANCLTGDLGTKQSPTVPVQT